LQLPQSGMSGRLTIGIVLLCGAAACHTGAPEQKIVATDAPARVLGRVGASDATLEVGGRGIEAVNLDTGERHTVLTGRGGDFGMTLTPGTWRFELRLEPGEALARSPAPITIRPATTLDDVRFVVAASRSRPHRPVTPRVPGLASPTA
jgi:hypothetical protein